MVDEGPVTASPANVKSELVLLPRSTTITSADRDEKTLLGKFASDNQFSDLCYCLNDLFMEF